MSTDTTQSSTDIYEPVKKHLINFSKPQNQLAWKNLAGSFALTFLAIVLIKTGNQLLGWTVQVFTHWKIFVQFHDTAHFSYFQTPDLNRLVGRILGVYVLFPFEAWRDGHNHHHRHFGNLDRLDLSQTILFTKKQYDQMKFPKKLFTRLSRQPILFFFVTGPYIWFVGLFFVVGKRYGVFSKAFAEKVLATLLFFVIIPALGVTRWKLLLAVYFSIVLGFMVFHVEHSVNIPYRERKEKWDFAKAALQGSTLLNIPKIIKLFSNGIEYHHIHHLNTNVASYNIQKCHESFESKEKGGYKWDDYHINRIDLWISFKSLANVMYDEEKKLLVPFSYKHL